VITVAVLNIASAQETMVTDEWITIRPPVEGFHVRLPPDWDQDKQGYPANELSFRPKRSRAAADEFINCKAQAGANPAIATSTQESLDAAVAAGPPPSSATKELLSTLGTDAAIRENGLMQVSNHPAYFIVVSGSHETSNVKIHVVAVQVILVRPGWMYSLACTTGARPAEQAEHAWTAWRPVFMGIVSTFDSETR
jgi:hypothetical protein